MKFGQMTIFLEPDSAYGSLMVCVALVLPLQKDWIISVMQELVLICYQMHLEVKPVTNQIFHATTAQRLLAIRLNFSIGMNWP